MTAPEPRPSYDDLPTLVPISTAAKFLCVGRNVVARMIDEDGSIASEDIVQRGRRRLINRRGLKKFDPALTQEPQTEASA